MYLLLDECVGRSLIEVARSLGHTAQRTVDVAPLGYQASDAEIFDFARRAGAVIVTVNRSDFIGLAARGRSHDGVILIPSVSNAPQRTLFATVLRAATPLFSRAPNLFVEIDAEGRIESFRLP